MSVYYLSRESTLFPPIEMTSPAGILAVGGDLSVSRLLRAYSNGIFPWYGKDDPLLWWSPDPRCVLIPEQLHVPSSLRKSVRKQGFSFSLDARFKEVMAQCARTARPDQDGTWINRDMLEAYTVLHALSAAHSVEVWQDGHLVGGLYGIALGRTFFGESMFYHVSDASKAAVVWLVTRLRSSGFMVIDCQQATEHMQRFGAREIPRSEFSATLAQSGAKSGDALADIIERYGLGDMKSVDVTRLRLWMAAEAAFLSQGGDLRSPGPARPDALSTWLSPAWAKVASASGLF